MGRRLTLLLLVVSCWMAWLLVEHGSKPGGAKQTAAEPRGYQLQEARAKDQAAYEQQTQARIDELARMEIAKRARDRLAVTGTEARTRLQAGKSAAWAAVISDNWKAFQELRKQASTSPEATTQCLICDGRGSMDFCVLCEHSGMCFICKGSGKNVHGEDCPACRGKGKCYLCFGSGKMPCPFCDDGLISSKVPLPPEQMPVLVETPVAQPSPPGVQASQQPMSASLSAPAQANEAPPPAPSDVGPPEISPETLASAVALLLAAVFAFRKLAPRIADFLNARFNPWVNLTAAAADVSSDALAEEQRFSEFIASFRAGPGALPRHSSSDRPIAPVEIHAKTSRDVPRVQDDPLRKFFAAVPEQLAMVRRLFSEISRTQEEAIRQKLLGELALQVRAFKGMSAVADLLPVWQLASALEGLLTQLANKASNVNPSGLRTAAAAVDLLETLSVPGLRPDLLTNPPVRLLAVDDDPIIRHAVSFALKKALNQPDVATNGKTALTMAERQRYDLVFLDVEMPGIEGFELCSKIHDTIPNRVTPVVFVTSHTDFDARAKSALTGAHDLIGKPFLTFEITVKALTLVLRARLGKEQVSSMESRPSSGNGGALLPPAHKSRATPRPALDPVVSPLPLNSRPATLGPRPSTPAPRLVPLTPPSNLEPRASALVPPSPDPIECAKTFFAQAPLRLRTLGQQIQALRCSVDPEARQRLLAELYLGIHLLSSEADRSLLSSAFRLTSTLERLVNKLLQHPNHSPAFALDTAASAFDLLDDLCVMRLDPGLANPPIRLLVVDDDPVARRAFSGALQLAFSKPDSVDSGEAALALAAEKPYDVIFLDVMMAGMDGFTTCAKIRQTVSNAQTPVVFVTSHNDEKSRAQSAHSGGSGFIPKPALAVEVTLAALTFALRSRMAKLKQAQVPGKVREAVSSSALAGVAAAG